MLTVGPSVRGTRLRPRYKRPFHVEGKTNKSFLQIVNKQITDCVNFFVGNRGGANNESPDEKVKARKKSIPNLERKKALEKIVESANSEGDIVVTRARGRYVYMRNKLLPPPLKEHENKKLLVLDLDETLIHSSFDCYMKPDFVIKLEIDNVLRNIFIRKRPMVHEFLEEVAKHFELAVFTAGSQRYADPVLNILDPNGLIKHRLYRKHCTFHQGYFKKDLSSLGRDLSQVILLDNSPVCYDLQVENGMAIPSFYEDKRDRELLVVLPWLKEIAKASDVYHLLSCFRKKYIGKIEFPKLHKPSSAPARIPIIVPMMSTRTHRVDEFLVRRRGRSGRVNPKLIVFNFNVQEARRKADFGMKD